MSTIELKITFRIFSFINSLSSNTFNTIKMWDFQNTFSIYTQILVILKLQFIRYIHTATKRKVI